MILRSITPSLTGTISNDIVQAKSGIFANFRTLSVLLRWKLSLGVTLSGGLGMLLARPVWDSMLLSAMAGIFCGSGGTSILNQIQDKNLDRLMTRTKDRPLAAGIIPDSTALLLVLIFLGLAVFLLGSAGNGRAVWPLAAIIVLYNGLYTPLKTKSSWFLPCGLAAGGLPPVLGWICGGGALLNFTALGLFSILILWQIPHFYRIYRRYAEDYRKAGVAIPLFIDQSNPERNS